MNNCTLFTIFFIVLSSCQNSTKKIDNILNISTENISNSQIIVEEQKLNVSFENPKWIYIRLPNLSKVREKILYNLVERNEKDFETKLCLSNPNFFYTSKGFWDFDETDLTRKKQSEILALLRNKKYREFGGFYNAKTRSFVSCNDRWNGRSIIYLSKEFIYIMILQTN